MSIKDIYTKYSALPPVIKGIVAVVALAGTAIVTYKLYNAVVKTDEQKANSKLEDAVSSEIDEAKKKYQPSFKDSEYLLLADVIHNSIKYCLGDDYSTAEATLKKMNNDLDVLLLMQEFGTRQSYCFGIPTDSYKLFTFINKELGNEWGGLTNYRVKSINADWKSKGITYQI